MKKSILSLCILFAVLLTACSKDDSPSDSLVGDWDYIAYVYQNQRYTADACAQQGWMSFGANEVSSQMYSYSGNSCIDQGVRVASYTISGNKIIAVNGTNQREIVYSISGDELTLNFNDDANNPTIQVYKRRDASANPFMGNWRLVAFMQNGQVIDVTGANVPCFKNSTLNVDATNFSLNFSAPKSQTDTSCQTATDAGTWRYASGKYYISQNGQETEFPISFSDNNTTLRFTYGQGSNAFDMIFKKM